MPDPEQEPEQEEQEPELQKAYVITDPSAPGYVLPELAEGVDPEQLVFARMSFMISREMIGNPRVSGRPPDLYLYGDENEVFNMMGQHVQEVIDKLHEEDNPDREIPPPVPSLREIPHIETAPPEELPVEEAPVEEEEEQPA